MPLRSELRAQVSLAAPLTVAYVGQMMMGLVDSLMLGRFSEEALAGSGIAGSVLFSLTALGMGVVMGLDTLIPQALGAGERDTARRLWWTGVRVCSVFGLPITALIAASPLLLRLFDVQPEVTSEATVYVWARLPGVIPFLIFIAQRSYLQALGRTAPIVAAMVIGNVLNVGLDAVLIHGMLGMPAMGSLGAALATVLVSLGSMAIAGAAVARANRELPAETPRSDPTLFRKTWHLGLPVGLHLLAEVGVFSLTAMLAGRLGKTPAAAHQISIALASFSFSLALGIGAATSVRVGLAVGRGDQPGVRRAGAVGIGLGTSLMGVGAILFATIPDKLAGLFTSEAHVIAAAVPLLRIAALFQLSDAVQAVVAGALRGAGDTRSTFIANLLGHYFVGLPIAIALAFGLDWGASGLWSGLVAGLTAVAASLTARFFWLARRPVERQ